jgi:transketolase
LESIERLRKIAIDIRRQIIKMIYSAHGGHIGGSLSSVDILVALYFHAMNYDSANPSDLLRDRFILSKGHSVEGLYAVLARAGFFPEAQLSEYGSFGGMLYGHPTLKVPGVEIPSGSLGHGLSVGVGMALAAKRDSAVNRVFVLMGDGEQAEGSVWEAAMAAGHYKLDNLVAVIDANRLQISGPVKQVMDSSPLGAKYESFGWSVREVDGHDLGELTEAFDKVPWTKDKPSLVLAHTIKGRGSSFMENDASWHHKTPSQDEYRLALAELEAEASALAREAEGEGK